MGIFVVWYEFLVYYTYIVYFLLLFEFSWRSGVQSLFVHVLPGCICLRICILLHICICPRIYIFIYHYVYIHPYIFCMFMTLGSTNRYLGMCCLGVYFYVFVYFHVFIYLFIVMYMCIHMHCAFKWRLGAEVLTWACIAWVYIYIILYPHVHMYINYYVYVYVYIANFHHTREHMSLFGNVLSGCIFVCIYIFI